MRNADADPRLALRMEETQVMCNTAKPVVLAYLASVLTGGWGCHLTKPDNPSNNQPGSSVTAACGKWQFNVQQAMNGLFQLASLSEGGGGNPRGLFQLARTTEGGGGGCKPDQCGLNGMWFGEGVQFRELHLQGAPNQQGFKLVSVDPPPEQQIPSGSKLVLGIRPRPDVPDLPGNELVLEDPRHVVLVRGLGMKHTRIHLESVNKCVNLANGEVVQADSTVDGAAVCLPKSKELVPLRIALFIQTVDDMPYWDCSSTDKEASCDHTYEYEFQASTNAGGGCDVALCNPDLATDPSLGGTWVQGRAVAFGGDVYDHQDQGFRIHSVSASATGRCPLNQLDKERTDIVNFACVGTTVSKLYLMRHTAASKRSDRPTTVSQRQAMLRMLTADYCGDGISHTENGTPIRFAARGWGDFGRYALAPRDPTRPPPPPPLPEAKWTDQGASCVDLRRLPGDRSSTCPAGSPPCKLAVGADLRTTLTPPGPQPPDRCDDVSGDYIVSAIPAVP